MARSTCQTGLGCQSHEAGSAQGRPCDLHRRNLADHRRGPRRHRLGLARVPIYEPDMVSPGWRRFASPGPRPTSVAAARDAPNPESATALGRGRHRRARTLRSSGNPLCRSPRWCSISPTGASPIRPTRLLDPRPPPAVKEARALLAATACSRSAGTHHRYGPQSARTAFAATPLAHGAERRRRGREREAADLAAVLVERASEALTT